MLAVSKLQPPKIKGVFAFSPVTTIAYTPRAGIFGHVLAKREFLGLKLLQNDLTSLIRSMAARVRMESSFGMQYQVTPGWADDKL